MEQEKKMGENELDDTVVPDIIGGVLPPLRSVGTSFLEESELRRVGTSFLEESELQKDEHGKPRFSSFVGGIRPSAKFAAGGEDVDGERAAFLAEDKAFARWEQRSTFLQDLESRDSETTSDESPSPMETEDLARGRRKSSSSAGRDPRRESIINEANLGIRGISIDASLLAERTSFLALDANKPPATGAPTTGPATTDPKAGPATTGPRKRKAGLSTAFLAEDKHGGEIARLERRSTFWQDLESPTETTVDESPFRAESTTSSSLLNKNKPGNRSRRTLHHPSFLNRNRSSFLNEKEADPLALAEPHRPKKRKDRSPLLRRSRFLRAFSASDKSIGALYPDSGEPSSLLAVSDFVTKKRAQRLFHRRHKHKHVQKLPALASEKTGVFDQDPDCNPLQTATIKLTKAGKFLPEFVRRPRGSYHVDPSCIY